jgi:hypothetical protein
MGAVMTSRAVPAQTGRARRRMRYLPVGTGFLLSGWLLMSPPVLKDSRNPDAHRVDTAAPISKWRQDSAHDTAKECEAEPTENYKISGTKQNKAASESTRRGWERYWLSSRCVPSEEVYPPAPKP